MSCDLKRLDSLSPTQVPCRLRLDDEGSDLKEEIHEVDGVNGNESKSRIANDNHFTSDPEPLHSLLNPLVGSQDPIDAFLITKVDIHQVSKSCSNSSNHSSNFSISECVKMNPEPRNNVGNDVEESNEKSIESKESCSIVIKDSEYVLMINNNGNLPAATSTPNHSNVPQNVISNL